jgi:hypothetical protein
MVEKLRLEEALLENERSDKEAANNVSGMFGIVPQKCFHI